MATLNAVNVTKYDAGGSGDNYISDGYIKSVEKVWIDSVATGTTALGSDDTLLLGYVPKNKKITEIVVQCPAISTDEGSLGTIFLGSAATFLMTAANCYLGAMKSDDFTTAVFNPNTATTLRLQYDKFATVTNKRVGIYAKLVMANGADVSETGATIRSIIRYT